MSEDRDKLEAQAKADLQLLRKAEAVLAELDRAMGLEDRHADVLAALRIRLEGGPRKSLDELMGITKDLQGKRGAGLDDRIKAEESKQRGDLDDLFAREAKKKKPDLGDLLG